MAFRLMRELCILLGKNMQLKMRAFVYTTFEILAPFIYAAMVYGVLLNRDTERHKPATSLDFNDMSTYKKSYIIGYAPANDITDDLMFRAAHMANEKYHLDLEAIGFVSEYQMMHFVRSHPTNIHSVYAFDNMTSHTKEIPETLHIILRPVINSAAMNTIAKEYKYDLHTMQFIMESYIYQLTGQQQNINVTWSNKAMLTTLNQIKKDVLKTILVLVYLLLAFLICRSVYCIAHEREAGITNLLSRTGVNMYMYWLSWFITVFVVLWLASLMVGIMMFVETPVHPRAYMKSDIYSVLLYFTLFAVACTCYCIMGSVICQKAHTTSIIATCLFLGTSFPLQIVRKVEFNNFFACVLINKNVDRTLNLIHSLEHIGKGFSLTTQREILFAYISICLCAVANAALARILYNCLKINRSLWMTLPECVYWKSNKSAREICHPMSTTPSGKDLQLKVGVVIDKLCASSPAPLETLTLNIYENKVTVISDLDGNSSMTFLSILTGETRPLKGSVKVTGLDIVTNIGAIRKMTSLCPKEHSAVLSTFTVLDNLKFFYQIKEPSKDHHGSKKLQEVIDMFELNNMLKTRVSKLSLAERRLLQIAIVYASNSKMLLFDYPTLDMDPYTKSKCWNVIRRNTEDKIVIVCTESIEEAEMVGDMIAVVSGGLMRSYDSIENIYHIYGIGYNLLIDKDINFNIDRLVMVVTELVHNAKIVDETDYRVIFLLPTHSAHIFFHLLTFLENHKAALGIGRFSINTVSLEKAILEKSTDISLLEIKDTSCSEINCSTPRRFDTYMSAIRENINEESSVDRRSTVPSMIEIFRVPTKLDVHNIPVEENPLIRYTGFKLMISQAEAMLRKKIIEKICSFHLEIVQLLILATLAVGLYSEPSPLREHEIDLDPRTLQKTVVRVVNEDVTSTISSRLTQRYKQVFMNTGVQVDEHTSQESTITNFQQYNIIGASFQWDNVSKVYHSIATHSTCGTGDEDLVLPASITAIMNAYLYYFTGNTQHFMYASKLSESDSLVDFERAKRRIARHVRIQRHHCSFLQSVSLLMAPYFAVLERTTGFKHLQHLSGVSSGIYWAVSLVNDLTTYLFLVLLYPIMGTLFSTGHSLLVFEHLELVTLACGVVMLLYIYVIQFAFNVPASAAFIICMLNYFLGDAATILSVLMGKAGEIFGKITNERIFLALPPCIFPYYIYFTAERERYYTLCKINMANCNTMEQAIRDRCCKVQCVDDRCINKQFVLAEQDKAMNLEIILALLFHFVFWAVMLLLIEYRIIQKIKKKAKHRKSSFGRRAFNIQSLFNRRKDLKSASSQSLRIDPGIAEHLSMLQYTSDDQGLIRIDGVDFTDSDFVGLPRLNFLLSKGESYCFVDTDKSSASNILKLLSGMIEPTKGKIIVKGQHFKVRGKPSYTPIGYCMETNSFVGSLTGREVLVMHAKLRGITDDDLSMVVDSTLKMLNLLDKADMQSGNYSPSDQRLLNVAVAVIGDPEIILLNDPFGNLDVVNKSLVWKALDESMSHGSTIIMCSDKVREISDKVTVVAILLNGDPVCIGSPENIRGRYCNSYTLLAKLDVSNNLPVETLITSLKERFPKCVIFYDHQDFLHMRIPYDDTTLPDVFALMESAKKHLKIQSYKLVHTNLSYVFTAMQQRAFEESTLMNECDEDDDDCPDFPT